MEKCVTKTNIDRAILIAAFEQQWQAVGARP